MTQLTTFAKTIKKSNSLLFNFISESIILGNEGYFTSIFPLSKANSIYPFYEEKKLYQVYFHLFTNREWDKEKKYYFDSEKKIALEKQNTLDVLLGEMHLGQDHDVQGELTEVGLLNGNKFRMAAPVGWFPFG